MQLHIVLLVTIVLIINKARCGVIENVYDKVSNTTHDIKEDVYSWWTYGVETVMGEDVNKNAANPETGEDQSGMIGKLYNKVKGGVTSGYMTVHDFVLGKDSDPNKGIIKTLYERAMTRLSNIKSHIFGEHADEKPESHINEETTKQEVLKLLFTNRTDIFNTENEKLALNSLRNKLTQTGDEVLHLAENEKDVLRRAYESVRQKSGELLTTAGQSAEKVKNKFNENVQKTQEFIQDQSKNVNEAAKSVGEEVHRSASDIQRLQSE